MVDTKVLARSFREAFLHRSRVVVCQSVVGHHLPVQAHHVGIVLVNPHGDGHPHVGEVHQLVEVEETYPVVFAGMVAVTLLISVALQAFEIGNFHKARLDVRLQNVLEQLSILHAVVVVDEYLVNAQTVVMLHPFHGVAVLQPADGTNGHLGTQRQPHVIVRRRQ